MVLLQTFVCPHCFDHFTRPVSALGHWRFVRWFLRKPWQFRKSGSDGFEPERGPVSWIDRFVEFGQTMIRLETWCLDTARSAIRRIVSRIFNRS